ncbi:MAG: hypothetical protein COA44_13295 [Arcobacter sp.]|nr:MAG: hypothetical protein COA44_13295 [Arcobacter sp.]
MEMLKWLLKRIKNIFLWLLIKIKNTLLWIGEILFALIKNNYKIILKRLIAKIERNSWKSLFLIISIALLINPLRNKTGNFEQDYMGNIFGIVVAFIVFLIIEKIWSVLSSRLDEVETATSSNRTKKVKKIKKSAAVEEPKSKKKLAPAEPQISHAVQNGRGFIVHSTEGTILFSVSSKELMGFTSTTVTCRPWAANKATRMSGQVLNIRGVPTNSFLTECKPYT